MLSSLTRHIATFLAVLVGILGVLGVLYAWHLPPFDRRFEQTEDAYVRGQIIRLAPQISGTVSEVAVRDFQRVRKGDLLVRLDDGIYVQQLARANAQLASAEAALAGIAQDRAIAESSVDAADAAVDAARAAFASASSDMDRATHLLARAIMTQSDADHEQLKYDQAEATLRQVEAQAETARQSLAAIGAERQTREAAVEAAKATVSLARIDLDNTRILAPVDARLGEVAARPGQYVTAGTQLAALVPDEIWIIANFKEAQTRDLRIGQRVSFTVDALGDARLSGHIDSFSPATGSQFSLLGDANASGNFIKIAQRIPVRVSVDRDQAAAQDLMPGMSVVLRAVTEAPASAS